MSDFTGGADDVMGPDGVAHMAASLADIIRERISQIGRHGWDPDHDDQHGPNEWGYLIARRAVELGHPWPDSAGIDTRRLLVEIAAIATAAIESHDRKERTG